MESLSETRFFMAGLQRDRSQTDQVNSCWLPLFSIHGKVPHMLEKSMLPHMQHACCHTQVIAKEIMPALVVKTFEQIMLTYRL